jgi:hypothetical protein
VQQAQAELQAVQSDQMAQLSRLSHGLRAKVEALDQISHAAQ